MSNKLIKNTKCVKKKQSAFVKHMLSTKGSDPLRPIPHWLFYLILFIQICAVISIIPW